MKGHFITFEGGEGSGKTTQLDRLGRDLLKRGYTVVQTREPGGTKIGDAIRQLILHPPGADDSIDPKTELFLYLASRAQHIREIILPALQEGKIVLCDRFTDATIVYQGKGRGLPDKEVARMARYAAQSGSVRGMVLKPDLTLLLDLEVKVGIARVKGRKEINRIDKETFQFHESVRRGYLNLAKRNPRRIHVINTDTKLEAVSEEIREVVDALLS
ncbi:MAG: dTMP kinase [Nitrospira sp.]|nr:dTMP kinase [Candidatus Manganitrophaceae bacterium]HIL34467.1 dTMP kinase [Candidatus Manganitrophaceae bacterium]